MNREAPPLGKVLWAGAGCAGACGRSDGAWRKQNRRWLETAPWAKAAWVPRPNAREGAGAPRDIAATSAPQMAAGFSFIGSSSALRGTPWILRY
eukprot:CAMPEP_0180124162 /NCGR_PEP_ID=MMETSP0986-20121125/4501_1 /TAXON_ID=697907 /ORGANISM="non described non described, Strain CCMP2293" /LENGTH=93 /DNA_ID=CAMNT_0022063477 /DNA_START=55 /DNA_END=336 /DNA_ORIENTATION=-